MRSNDGRPYRDMHWLGWVVFALVLVAIVAFFGTMLASGYYMPMMVAGYPFYGWFFFPFGFAFFVISAVIVFRLIFWGFGGWGWRRRYWHSAPYGYGDAQEILRQRYARGEITKDQFDQMMKDIEHH
ncbi:MAG: SHOCT domain-containing protein [Nitrososphaerota archaeon]|nr:SHOCT domain-containing protein [Nitrososphaerota archaeon]MDG7017479.1 SHOCT domain-containing protein [Nitrososphaerota archaeon]MDG7019545.1 SHOCT domain-containing protein [Nitrososphaerota archaeon]